MENIRETKSETDTDEENKRKREEFDDLFGRSKITKRTPSKISKGNKEGTEERMIIMMRELMNKNDEMMDEIKQIRKEQKENHEQIRVIKQENEVLKKEIKDLNEKFEHLERMNKKKNLIISGMKLDTNDDKILKGTIENFISQELKLNVKLKSVGKIGEKVCVIETESMTDKLNILKNKKQLKNLTERIYIDSDLTKKEREIQKVITDIAKEERSKGNSVNIGYKKLMINGKAWNWDVDRGELIQAGKNKDTKN